MTCRGSLQLCQSATECPAGDTCYSFGGGGLCVGADAGSFGLPDAGGSFDASGAFEAGTIADAGTSSDGVSALDAADSGD
jgi:hypothetical protein